METVTRGAASAIFSPDNFVHPLLLLMPYGPGAPKHLRQLESSVLEALEPEADAESRTAAALGVRDAIHRPGARIPDPAVLLIEVLRRVTADLPRPVLLECWGSYWNDPSSRRTATQRGAARIQQRRALAADPCGSGEHDQLGQCDAILNTAYFSDPGRPFQRIADSVSTPSRTGVAPPGALV